MNRALCLIVSLTCTFHVAVSGDLRPASSFRMYIANKDLQYYYRNTEHEHLFANGSLDARLVWDGKVQVKQDDNGHLYLNNGLAMLPPLPTDRGDLNITVELSDCATFNTLSFFGCDPVFNASCSSKLLQPTYGFLVIPLKCLSNADGPCCQSNREIIHFSSGRMFDFSFKFHLNCTAQANIKPEDLLNCTENINRPKRQEADPSLLSPSDVPIETCGEESGNTECMLASLENNPSSSETLPSSSETISSSSESYPSRIDKGGTSQPRITPSSYVTNKISSSQGDSLFSTSTKSVFLSTSAIQYFTASTSIVSSESSALYLHTPRTPQGVVSDLFTSFSTGSLGTESLNGTAHTLTSRDSGMTSDMTSDSISCVTGSISPSICPSVRTPAVSSSSPTGGLSPLSFGDRSDYFFIVIFSTVGGGVILLLFCSLILLCASIKIRLKKKAKYGVTQSNRSHRKGKSKSGGTLGFISPMSPPTLWTALSWGTARSLETNVYSVVMDYGVSRSKVAIHSVLKTGTYGCELRGRLISDKLNPENPNNQSLRIKMLAGFKPENGKKMEDVAKFLHNASLTKGLHHNNVLRLVGVCAEEGYVPLVLYEWCNNGNLHHYLEQCRLSGQNITVQYLINFCLQIVEGMLYLSQNDVVHPDLALRNCFLDSNFTVKVGDGTLSPDFYPDLYHSVYGVKRPVRWSALETLTQGISGIKSNVWSFGIVCIEVFTLAEVPYESVPNRNIMAHVLLGHRPLRPNRCPPEIYELLHECWLELSHYRPGFAEIAQRLQIFAKEFTAKEAAEIEGLLEDLGKFKPVPYRTPTPPKDDSPTKNHVELERTESAITISDTCVQSAVDNDEVFLEEKDGPVEVKAAPVVHPRINSITQSNNGSRPPSVTYQEFHTPSTSTFSYGPRPFNAILPDGRPASILSTTSGSYRGSPLPSPRASSRQPVPVNLPRAPIAMHSESAIRSTSSEPPPTKEPRPLKTSAAKPEDVSLHQTSGVGKGNSEKRDSKRDSDPFTGLRISLGDAFEDDIMATFDTLTQKNLSN